MNKRMKLISEEDYIRLINSQSRALPDTGEKLSFFNQQVEGDRILEDKIPDDIKVQVYSRFKNSRNKKL